MFFFICLYLWQCHPKSTVKGVSIPITQAYFSAAPSSEIFLHHQHIAVPVTYVYMEGLGPSAI